MDERRVAILSVRDVGQSSMHQTGHRRSISAMEAWVALSNP